VPKGLAVVSGHPFRRFGRQFLSVPLQLGQVVERIGAAQLAGVNQIPGLWRVHWFHICPL
jgi:hypothetical protein